ncbi:MAG TPA: hypothetical protein VNT75_02565, partial [Symbiobacteriaceae bacterium]|nr:hypothetical protein [Symbiobacteriaceae bacterium]
MRSAMAVLLLFLLTAAGCAAPAARQSQPADPCAALVLTERDGVEWLKQRAVPLTNLEPLRATLAGVHTVALGEAT